MNRCSPPRRAIRSSPGRRYRWYVLHSRISAPDASTSRGVTPLTAPCVPTGMNAGVCTTPCAVVRSPARAGPSVWVTRKPNADTACSSHPDLTPRTTRDQARSAGRGSRVRCPGPKQRWEQRYVYTVPVKKLRVGVVYGGRSGEHEVSLASAAAVFQNLDPDRYETVAIRIEKDGRWALPRRAPSVMKAADVIHAKPELSDGSREAHLVAHPGGETLITIDRRDDPSTGAGHAVVSGLALDVVFPVLHGPYGEDGTVQGLLELANIPYVGAGVLASAVGMDKAAMKLVFAAKQLPICDYHVVMKYEWRRDERSVMKRVGALGFPVFVKPANLGSSVGISKARHAAELRDAIALA